MQLALTTGAYQTRSVVASAQRSVNLYPEKNDPSSPFPFTMYPTPGLKPLAAALGFPHRCTYPATNGVLYEVVGPFVYAASRQWVRTLIGQIANGPNPVSMQDNGLAILLVDGTINGYAIDLSTNDFAPVSGQNGAFLGSDFVDIIDGFFQLSQPGTNIYYISLENVSFANLTGTVSPDATAAAFDPLDIATKSGYPDPIARVRAMHNEAWLIGTNTTEIWNDAGNADFAFQRLPGVFIEHGCAAKYSVAKADLALFWLSLDQQGQCMVLMGAQYAVKRVTTHAIEAQFAKYATISDAIGFTYLQEGHVTYQLTFPTANATWCYDVSQELWFEKTWTDANGLENRHRANDGCFVYGVNVVGDFETGALYQLDLATYTDFGGPIVRRRGWPIVKNENRRLSYPRFVLDIEVAGNPNDLSAPKVQFGQLVFTNNSGGQIFFTNNLGGQVIFDDFDGLPYDVEDAISLRWSDTSGKSWGNPLAESLGSTGQDLRSVAFRQLGMARSRVFEVFWALPYQVALNGAFAEVEQAET
jgi:hypothetical protein